MPKVQIKFESNLCKFSEFLQLKRKDANWKIYMIFLCAAGSGNILVEWRRSKVIYGKIDFFIVYYKSKLDHTYFKRKIEVGSKNSSDLYLVSKDSAQ